jgi:hypothetical protein
VSSLQKKKLGNGHIGLARIAMQEHVSTFHDVGLNFAVAYEFRQFFPFGGLEMNGTFLHDRTIAQPRIFIKLRY